MKAKNYLLNKSKLSICLASTRIYITLAAMLFSSVLMAQNPVLVSSDAKDPNYLIEYDGELFFAAKDQNNKRWLWKTDGTTTEIQSGIVQITHPGHQPEGLTVLNNQLIFSAVHGDGSGWNRELYKYEIGAFGGYPSLIKNIQDSGGSEPTRFTEFDDKLYFSADDGSNGQELWITDGSESGTQLLKNIYTGSYGSYPRLFTEYNGSLIFKAIDDSSYFEPWITDGTTAGTQKLKDIYPGYDGSDPYQFTEYDNKLYFSAYNYTYELEAWVTDGTTAGTELLKDIVMYGSSNPAYFTEYNGLLFFRAGDFTYGAELWVTDGTESGTQLFKDINQGGDSSNIESLGIYDGNLYFGATDASGDGLWVTDGSSLGTVMVKSFDSKPIDLFTYDNRLYFTALDSSNGRQLWSSDGTAAGTMVVSPPVAPNVDPIDSSVFEHVVIDGELYYTADYDGNGLKLYQLTTNNLSTDDYAQSEFLFYPNPVQDVLHLETKVDDIQKIELFSIAGQRLQSWKGQSKINLSEYNSGNYLVKITTENNKSVTKQIIKK